MADSEIILYTVPDDVNKNIEVIVLDETVWLTQKAMSKLLGTETNTINYHLEVIFKCNELQKYSVIRKLQITAADGEQFIPFYNLDAIISVGYRVNPQQTTQFRIWATRTLKSFIIKGFVHDLNLGNKIFGKDYFDKLLGRLQEIRGSESQFHKKITDAFSEYSIDYNPKADIASTFNITSYNMIYWGIAGQNAAEIISSRANAELPNMGLTIWKNFPYGNILKSDITVAKNYLTKKETEKINKIVNAYLDSIESQLIKQIPMTMNDLYEKIDTLLQFNDYTGSISLSSAKKFVNEQYDIFKKKSETNNA